MALGFAAVPAPGQGSCLPCVLGSNAALWYPAPPAANSCSRIANTSFLAPGVLDGFNDFTIELNFRADGFNCPTAVGSANLLRKGDHINNQVWSVEVSDFFGQISLVFSVWHPGGIQNIPANAPPGTNLGLWQHVAIARTAGIYRVYWGGGLVATHAPVPLGTTSTVSQPIYFGRESSGGAPGLRGALDEIRIWNVGRSAAEIASSWNQGLVGPQPGLLAYWRMDEGSGTAISNSASAPWGLGSVADALIPPNAQAPASWTAPGCPLTNYCAPGTGWSNSAAASLIVNGTGGPSGTPGPHVVTIPLTGAVANRIALQWSGPAGMPVVLAAGLLAPGCLNLGPGIGTLDLAPASLFLVLDGTVPFPNPALMLDGSGAAVHYFILPPGLAPGIDLFDIQGGILQAATSGVPIVLTSAFRIRT